MKIRKVFVVTFILILLVGALPSTMAQDDEITLRVMHWTPTMTMESDWWSSIVEGFEAEHPNVTIESNFVAFAQYLPTLEAMIAGEELPDVFFGHVKSAEIGRAGKSVAYNEVFEEDFINQFSPGPLRQFTFDGNVYALPWTAQMFGVFVNREIMEELDLEPPETWSDLIAMSPAINEAGYVPLSWGNAAMNICPDFVLPIITQYGGDVYALDDLTDPDVSWDSEPVIQALELLQTLVENDVFIEGINGVTEDQGHQFFYLGRSAMHYTGSWVPGQIFDLQAPEEFLDNYYVVKNPALTPDDIHWSGNGSGEGWVVKADSPNTEMALEFVQYLFSEEAYTTHITATQNMPSIPDYADLLEKDMVREMTEWVETDGANHILFGKGSWDAVANVCAGILDGSVGPEEGAAQIQADVLAARER
ncbi:extracellular solute-binding protein [candidate division KSB3 bacterium]|nr:extracellular solute-binding protein [candidate division KSB3 bacterium]